MEKMDRSGGRLSSGFLSKELETWIDIDASAERIWQVLANVRDWQSWNTFIPTVEGDLVEGRSIRIKVVPPGLDPMVFKPKVYAVRPFREIRWGGRFLWFMYWGDHTFLLEPHPAGGTRFRQIERFRGPLTLLLGKMLNPTERGYRQMNAELKRRVESVPFAGQ